MHEKEITFIELFAGIGGFRFGLEKASEWSKHSKLWSGNSKRRVDELSAQQRVNQGNTSSDDKFPRFRCVWANEIDKYASKIYQKNFGTKELIHGDITKIKTKNIPNADLLVAGFPCQSFSIAGKREGFSDTRGTMFFEIARIVKSKKPKFLLLENVKGLLSAQKGYCFFRILKVLDELGYDLQWQVLNSKHFGVPQNRERVFIIGHLRDASRPEIFPVTENGQTINEVGTVVRTLQGGAKSGGLHNNMTGIISKTVRSSGRASLDRHSWDLIQVGNVDTKGHNSIWGRVYSPDGVSPNLNAKGVGLGAKTGLIECNPVLMRFKRTEKAKQARAKIQKEEGRDYTPFGPGNRELVPTSETEVGCVTNTLNNDTLVARQNHIRRLTPVECERLQGFPDNYTKFGHSKKGVVEYEPVYDWVLVTDNDGSQEEVYKKIGKKRLKKPVENTVLISDTQRYKCLGNAVTTNVITFLGTRLLQEIFS